MTGLPLSQELRERTAAAHEQAERSPFLTALVAGRLTREGLAALLGRLAVVYAALEQEGERWAQDPVVAPFLLPGPARTARLEQDLEALGGGVAASPGALAYADRVRAQAGSRAGYLAHHYTRLLGDLSGGQVMGAALARALGLTEDHGLAFFSFPGLQPGPATRRYRASLDALPFDQGERAHLVGEALVAYRLNVALTAELDASLSRWVTG